MISIVEPHGIIETPTDGIMELVERAARTCYKSEDQINEGSAEKIVRRLIKSGHESVLEHASISARIICDRSCSHQIVRHRIAAISQASQRYINYGQKPYSVICPPSIGLAPGDYRQQTYRHFLLDGTESRLLDIQNSWLLSVYGSYKTYLSLLFEGIKPEDARSVLPNATTTEVFVTYNLRMWRHLAKERAINPHAQWQIREIFHSLLVELATRLPAVFDDLLEN